MKSLLIYAAVLFAGALAFESGQVCEPGTNFTIECNTCRCSADGKLRSCTKKICLPEEQGDDPKVQPVEDSINGNEKNEEQVHTNGQICTPNEVKTERCKYCKCDVYGMLWLCTSRECQQQEKRYVVECTPGTTFKSADGCNDCTCTETGMAACTIRLCVNQTKPKQCEPGSIFLDSEGCNTCTCDEDGFATCTLMRCFKIKRFNREVGDADLPRSEIAPWDDGFSCDPRKAFKYQCNTCRCDDTGRRAACTLKVCIPGEF